MHNDRLSIDEAAELLAIREAEQIQENLLTKAAEGAIARRNELLAEAKAGGAIKVDTEMANAIANETIKNARAQLSEQLQSGIFLASEEKALDKIAKSNVEAVAALYFPQAYKELENKRTDLARKVIAYKTKRRRLEKRESDVKKKIETLSNKKKNEHRLKLWFWKELTSNILVLQFVIFIGIGVGIFIGIQIPDGVVCKKNGICDIFRLQEKRIF
jgi:hypothetical protein